MKLQKTISQPELKRTDIWYVDRSEQNLETVIEDAKRAITEVGLPWFDRFRDAQEVLRTLLEDSVGRDGTHGFGANPSPFRHLMIGYVALSLGKTQVALQHIHAALLSGCFKDLEQKMRLTLQESNQS
jgi:hypothetical protein